MNCSLSQDNPLVVIVGCVSNFSHGDHQLTTIRKEAERAGYRLVGADSAEALRSEAAKEQLSLVGLETVAIPLLEPIRCVEILQKMGPNAVLSYKEAYVELCSEIAEGLGLRGNQPAMVRRIRRKDQFRSVLRAQGMRQPQSVLLKSIAEAKALLENKPNKRWVLKPQVGSGSVGVSEVSDPAELEGAFRQIPHGDALLEEFVIGQEFSAEGLFLGGDPTILALTRKQINSNFVELGHEMPARLSDEESQAAENAVEQALMASGLSHGIFHFEFWMTSQGVVLGELHIRPGGDFLHLLLSTVRPGLEIYRLLMDDLLGIPLGNRPIPPITESVAIHFFETPISGNSAPALDALPGFIHLDVGKSRGSASSKAHDSSQRSGSVIFAGSSSEECRSRLRRGLALIREPEISG